MNVTGTQYGVILTPLILSRLPPEIRLEWARRGEGKEGDLGWLLDFLEKEIKSRERSQIFKEAYKPAPEEKSARVATAAALHTESQRPSSSATSTHGECGICSKTHMTASCWVLTRSCSVGDRRAKITSAGLCFRCLKRGHFARGCVEKCARCKGRHHILLCEPRNPRTAKDKSVSDSSSVNRNFTNDEQSETIKVSDQILAANMSMSGVACSAPQSMPSKSRVMLQTVRGNVYGKRGVTSALVMFDTGSDRTYITSRLVREVEPEWVGTQSVAYAAFGSGKSTNSELRNVYQVHLKNTKGNAEPVFVTEVPVICAPLYRQRIPDHVLKSCDQMQLADVYEESGPVQVDILICLDSYWKLVKPGILCLSEGLVAQETLFGWVVSGLVSSPKEQQSVVSHRLLCLNDVSDVTLRNFWDLESLGIRNDKDGVVDPVLQGFSDTVNFSDGRYEVSLPWKDSCGGRQLMNNEKLAKKRLDSLSRKLAKDTVLKKRYDEALEEMEVNGVIEEVPPAEFVSPYPTFYMPHRPIIKESRVTTKIRPVFDASAAGKNGVSLNDCLETGPSMIPNLVSILIRFRRWLVALTADITKAFLQVKVCRPDRDVHRFFWEQDGRVRVMRFTRVPFGNKSSPFLLNATVQHHLSQFPPTRVVEELKANMYVDDWITGADSDEEGCSMLEEATEIMNRASMPLAKWESNSEVVSDKLY